MRHRRGDGSNDPEFRPGEVWRRILHRVRDQGPLKKGVRTDVPAELVIDGQRRRMNEWELKLTWYLPLLHSWQRLQTAPGSRETLSPGFKWVTFAPTLIGVSDYILHNSGQIIDLERLFPMTRGREPKNEWMG